MNFLSERHFYFALMTFFVISNPPLITATSLRPLAFEEQTQGAENFCAVLVKSSQVERRGSNVFTRYQLETLDCFKGSLASGQQVDLSVIGGRLPMTVSNQIQITRVPGAPLFQVGEKWVMSFKRHGSEYSLQDWQMLEVENEAEQFFVKIQPTPSRHALSPGHRQTMSRQNSESRSRLSFDEFRQKVRNSLD